MITTGPGWSVSFPPVSCYDRQSVECHFCQPFRSQTLCFWVLRRRVSVLQVCSSFVKAMLLVPLPPPKKLLASVTHNRLVESQAEDGLIDCLAHVAMFADAYSGTWLYSLWNGWAKWKYTSTAHWPKRSDTQDTQITTFPPGRHAEATRFIRRIIEEINQLQDDE